MKKGGAVNDSSFPFHLHHTNYPKTTVPMHYGNGPILAGGNETTTLTNHTNNTIS